MKNNLEPKKKTIKQHQIPLNESCHLFSNDGRFSQVAGHVGVKWNLSRVRWPDVTRVLAPPVASQVTHTLGCPRFQQ